MSPGPQQAQATFHSHHAGYHNLSISPNDAQLNPISYPTSTFTTSYYTDASSLLATSHNMQPEKPLSLFKQTQLEDDEQFYSTFPGARQAAQLQTSNQWQMGHTDATHFPGAWFAYHSTDIPTHPSPKEYKLPIPPHSTFHTSSPHPSTYPGEAGASDYYGQGFLTSYGSSPTIATTQHQWNIPPDSSPSQLYTYSPPTFAHNAAIVTSTSVSRAVDNLPPPMMIVPSQVEPAPVVSECYMDSLSHHNHPTVVTNSPPAPQASYNYPSHGTAVSPEYPGGEQQSTHWPAAVYEAPSFKCESPNPSSSRHHNSSRRRQSRSLSSRPYPEPANRPKRVTEHSPHRSQSPIPYIPSSRRSVTLDRKPTLACMFCRGRKIACGPPHPDSKDLTCNQCKRRDLICDYPTESRRGMRKKNVDDSSDKNESNTGRCPKAPVKRKH